MKMSENELMAKCMDILVDQVGPVEAERFVYVLNRENFDYTEWQRNLFEGETVDSLFDKIDAFQKRPVQDASVLA